MNLRCLVTGGSGFIGMNLLEALSANERIDHVLNVDRCPPARPLPKVESVLADVNDLEEMTRLLTGVDRLFHLAADSNVDLINADPSSAVHNNVGATAVLLEAARRAGVGRFLFASTAWVYMSCIENELSEATGVFPPGPGNLYAATKVAGELLCTCYHTQFATPTTVFRFSTPYGRYMRPELVVRKFIEQARRGEAITIAGGGAQTRNFLYAGDLADAVVAGALCDGAAGKTYNLTGPRPVTIKELAETVCAVVPDAAPVQYVNGRAADFAGKAISHERATTDLGWSPATDLATGVRRMYDWLCGETPLEPPLELHEPLERSAR